MNSVLASVHLMSRLLLTMVLELALVLFDNLQLDLTASSQLEQGCQRHNLACKARH